MIFRKIAEIQDNLKSEKEKFSSDVQYWIRFLQTSSKHYKHSFDEQIMINLLNPEFTACADSGLWKKYGFSINRGHGVPTLYNGKIRFLFDITQTSAAKGTRPPWIWKINDEKLQWDCSETVSRSIADKYGLVSETFEERLYELTLKRTAEYLTDENTLLFKTVSESAAYAVIYRCCPDEAQPSLKNLAGLQKYPTDEIGQAVTDISKSIFSEIESIVKSERKKAIEQIRRNDYEYQRDENNRRSETRIFSGEVGISSGYNDTERQDVHSGRGEFPVLSHIPERSSGGTDNRSGETGMNHSQ